MLWRNHNIIFMYGKQLSTGFILGYRRFRNYFHKKYLPHNYKFNSPAPYHQWVNQHKLLAKHQWKSEKQQQRGYQYSLYVILFIGSFTLTDYMYSGLYNPKQEYRLRITNAIFWKKIDDLICDKDVNKWIELLSKFWAKNQLQFDSFWDQFSKMMSTQQQKNKIHDKKIEQLRQQVKQVESKYPNLVKVQKRNVF